MGNETKIVRGGFRASLALIISIIALIIAIVAYNRETDFKAQIKDLQDSIKTLKTETSETVTKVRQETSKALEKIGIEIKKEGSKEAE